MPTKTKSRRSKRELIAPKGSKRYIRRNRQGEFKKEVNVGRLLVADRRRQAKQKCQRAKATAATRSKAARPKSQATTA